MIRKFSQLYTLVQEEKEKSKKEESNSIRMEYAKLYKKNEIKQNRILYESFQGRGMICNPYAIFKELKAREEFQNMEHYWTLESLEDIDAKCLMEEYKADPKVHFVKIHSMEYLEILTSAKYLINNMSFPAYMTKKADQIYVNTWNGIPVKKTGYDLPDGALRVRNIIRNFLAADYLISANDFMTKVYKESFRLDGIYGGEIIQTGQPRNDLLFHVSKSQMAAKLNQYNVTLDLQKKIVLYAPTWEETDDQNPESKAIEYEMFYQTMKANLDFHHYQLLIKPHQAVYRCLKNRKTLNQHLIPSGIDTNEMLAVTDILISDDSSTYLDFLCTNRPVLFYIPDHKEYETYHGLYKESRELPGPKAKQIDELVQWICQLDDMQKQWEPVYQRRKQWACEEDDGMASKRIVDTVFLQNRTDTRIYNLSAKKKKLLFYGGDLRENGITHSLFSLLKLIDHQKYDVSILTVFRGNEEVLKQIPANTRVFVQPSANNSEAVELSMYHMMVQRQFSSLKFFQKEMFVREYRRLFGMTEFDTVIEYNGYSPWYASLFAVAPKAQKYIWQHNDLIQECNRNINEKESLKQKLTYVFSLYPMYDKIVGCSKSVMEENRKHLETDTTREKFTYARNTLDLQRMRHLKMQMSILSMQGKSYYIKENREVSKGVQYEMELLELPENQMTIFAAMGRLSEEKNHSNLIQGFRKLKDENSKVMLYIIGDGPLKQQLNEEVKKLRLETSVIFTGNLKNPFGLIDQADCFILPSNYEGQPLVVQEARALEKPLILSDFSTVNDVCIEDGQLVVGKDVDSLFNGMHDFLEGKVPSYTFDGDDYNQEVYQEFEALWENE